MIESSFISLKPEHISHTVDLLHKRIVGRFPDRGLSSVSKSLRDLSKESGIRAAQLSQPIYWLRFLSTLAVISLFIPLVLVSSSLQIPDAGIPMTEFIQSLEAGLNDIILIGAAIYFLFSLERRIRRLRALKALDELRSMSHIIDMHQLSKDPESYFRGQSSQEIEDTALSKEDLAYYLDYCSEMLSLVGKIAALYASKLDDSTVLQAVNEVEFLTTSMSGKIWQKIMILHQSQA